jgi:hypothetical protein
MRRSILIFILGVGATLLTLYLVERVRSNAVRVPPWHPFEVRSDLRLDDLVADGYRFSDMPCGMVHFSKTIGDTTIRYYVDIDCKDYTDKHETRGIHGLNMIPPMGTDTSEQQPVKDPHWPFDAREVRGCYQHIYWRHYWFSMETIDSLAIRQFVWDKGGHLFAEHWNSTTGGEFMVENNTTNSTMPAMRRIWSGSGR